MTIDPGVKQVGYPIFIDKIPDMKVAVGYIYNCKVENEIHAGDPFSFDRPRLRIGIYDVKDGLHRFWQSKKSERARTTKVAPNLRKSKIKVGVRLIFEYGLGTMRASSCGSIRSFLSPVRRPPLSFPEDRRSVRKDPPVPPATL